MGTVDQEEEKRPGKMAGDLRGECHQHQMAKGEAKLVAGSASLALDLCAGTRGHTQKGSCAWCHALLSMS